jgi:tetratricopeptide (TPR) repeat protein
MSRSSGRILAHEQMGYSCACMDQPGYKAFLSYSHRDAKWANALHKALEAYRPPKQLVGVRTVVGEVPKRLTPIFRDREELASATDLGSAIKEALQRSACQIVICSPQAAKSPWVDAEILAFKRLGREDRIFCVIVDGEPNASDNPATADQECFPPALRFRLGADGNLSQARTEPIAADARPGKDGKNNAKLKLIAGVLGVGFDTLRRREQQRRYRQLLVIACAAMAGMLVTSGLAGYALFQRSAAERQTVRAESEAETARQTTNFLVDLFRIYDPSEARGNAITAREMLDKGAARIELVRQPAIRATLMDTVGTVYMGLGLYRQARPLLDQAVATRRGGDAHDPLALSISLEHIGDLLTGQAEFAAAEKDYRDAIALQSSQAKDPRAQTELAKTLHGFGKLQEREGRYADAQLSLRKALDLGRKSHGMANSDIAVTQKDLALAMADGGDLQGAIPVLRTALATQRELRGTAPHPDLAEAINDLALLLHENGDYDESAKLFRESLAMNRRLLGEKHPEIATGLHNLAAVLHDKGDLLQAESTYREALAMRRELLGETHPDVAVTLNNLAFVQYDRGDTSGALATERQSLAVFQRLFPAGHPDVARIMNRIGGWLTEAGDYAEADRQLRAALAMRRRLLGETHPDVGTSLINLALLQVAEHQYGDALASARGAVDILSRALSPTSWKTALAQSAEGAALSGLRQYAEAEPLLVHSLAILTKDGAAPPEYGKLTQKYLDELHTSSRKARASVSSSRMTATTNQIP